MCAVKVEQSHFILQVEVKEYAVRVGKCVVAFLHDHALHLCEDVIIGGLFLVGRYDAANDIVGVEFSAHDIGGEVVVDAAVVGQRAVNLDGAEYEGKGHGGSHGITQIATSEHYLSLVVYI